MFKKTVLVIFFILFAFVVNTALFSQTATIDTALQNAAQEIAETVPRETKIAIINITSDYSNVSDYIINELIINLVNKRLFQIVPRNAVELEAANKELTFQMSGSVSDESAKSLGNFLGAGTIITGGITRDSGNSYRLIINAIDLESFTYQCSYRDSIQNNSQIRELIASSGENYNEDYTVAERIGMGALNMFFGVGSILQGQPLGWVTTGVEAAGVAFLAFGLGMNPTKADYKKRWIVSTGEILEWDQSALDNALKAKQTYTISGAALIGGAVIFGYIIPFFHHKQNNTNVSQKISRFNFELVPSANQDMGIRLTYKMKL